MISGGLQAKPKCNIYIRFPLHLGLGCIGHLSLIVRYTCTAMIKSNKVKLNYFNIMTCFILILSRAIIVA